jgi:hypothetical protein
MTRHQPGQHSGLARGYIGLVTQAVAGSSLRRGYIERQFSHDSQ